MATKKTTTAKKQTKSALSTGSVMGDLLSSVAFKGYKRGETVKGKVSMISGRTVFVDIGGKTEAIVADQEYDLARDYFRALKVGDDVAGVVLVSENDAGQVVLSLRRAVTEQRWKLFEGAYETGATISAKLRESTKGGVIAEVEGVSGFIPASQFSVGLEGKISSLIGTNVDVKVLEVDRVLNRIVFSQRAVIEEHELEERKKLLSAVEVGAEYKGTVTGIVPFGAFVMVKAGKGKSAKTVEGLVHVSEISWEKIDDIGKILKEGSELTVKVIGIDEENGKLALSVKRLSQDPWIEMSKKYPVDSKHKGTVTKVMPYGVLVKLEKGIEGLIHASKMPVDRAFSEGQDVDVFVESVDIDKRRLSLGVVIKATKDLMYK